MSALAAGTIPMVTTPTEADDLSVRREVRLGVPADFELPLLTDAVREADAGGRTSRPIAVVTERPEGFTSEYYDTPDLRLVRRGVTLQRRHGSSTSWILELPRPTKSGTRRADCRLIEQEVDATGPPDALLDLLAAYVRSSRLQPVAHLQTSRATHGLRDRRGRAIAEVDDDSIAVFRGNRVAARFRHLEIDVDSTASGELLDVLVEQLREAGASSPDPLPAMVRALGPRALAAAELEPTRLGPTPTGGEVLQEAMKAAVRLLLDHDHVIRLDDDIEGVHQARVGTRRLRSQLRAYRSLFDATWSATLSSDLKWLAAILGEVRDGDVLLERLERAADDLPDKPDRRVARHLVARLSEQRTEAQRSLLEALQSERYIGLLDEVVDAVSAPRLDPSAQAPASDLLPRLVKRPYRKVKKMVERVGLDPSDDELHELRIDVKRARYAAEVATPALGPSMRAFAKALAAFGDLLGDHHDASVAEDWLRSAARHVPRNVSGSDSRAMALVAGQLIAGQREQRRVMRRELPATWERVTLAEPFGSRSEPST